ncbi:hypothetical protein HU147_17650 [Planomicrobium chinense]|uniref:hypothetical protein n=1 Tax=Planococcus chinensis TaxID=272917 RepID=UPI001CC7875E|nr:hypothetical protein [Planococcus chinensis]MBZ5203029.1 hypothetical protein [Planococcus chinensis]
MNQVYVTQEAINSDEEFIRFDEIENVSKFYIGPCNVENYNELTRDILIEFICAQANFPVFLTFEPYKDVVERIERAFQNKQIPYSLRFERQKNKSIPVFLVAIHDSTALHFVLQETYWLASSNQFYVFSFSENIRYSQEVMKSIFGFNKSILLPYIQMSPPATVLKVWHDGQGFLLYTSDSRYSSVEKLMRSFPKSRIVERI